jgi:glycosyltransferase involved in cell wall biosynthesis
MINNGENGLLVDFFSPDKIADKVVEVLENPDYKQTLGMTAREKIVTSYNLPQLLQEHLQWLLE